MILTNNAYHKPTGKHKWMDERGFYVKIWGFHKPIHITWWFHVIKAGSDVLDRCYELRPIIWRVMVGSLPSEHSISGIDFFHCPMNIA